MSIEQHKKDTQTHITTNTQGKGDSFVRTCVDKM